MSKAIDEVAADWVVKQTHGLKPRDEAHLKEWLSVDERHRTAFAQAREMWAILGNIPVDVARTALPAIPLRKNPWPVRWGAAVSLAAAIVTVLLWAPSAPNNGSGSGTKSETIHAGDTVQEVTLSDGSIVHLNRATDIEVRFTPQARVLKLRNGEAHFQVTKDPARPFIVQADDLEVKAVGTAFNVRFDLAGVQVLVTEGKIKLTAGSGSGSTGPDAIDPTLGAGESASYAISGENHSKLNVALVSPEEIHRRLAWHYQLIALRGAKLGELVEEFSRRTGHSILLADPTLADLEVGGQVRSADVNNFVGSIAAALDLVADRRGDGTFVLRRKQAGEP
ncbi:MAG: FecR domain-containing protein [Opitutus sp.]